MPQYLIVPLLRRPIILLRTVLSSTMSETPALPTPSFTYLPNTTAILGPLTSSFSQPEDCTSSYLNCVRDEPVTCLLTRDVSCGDDGRPTRNRQCFPPGTMNSDYYWSKSTWLRHPMLYSPGTACPSGYIRRFIDNMDPRVTNCCPR